MVDRRLKKAISGHNFGLVDIHRGLCSILKRSEPNLLPGEANAGEIGMGLDVSLRRASAHSQSGYMWTLLHMTPISLRRMHVCVSVCMQSFVYVCVYVYMYLQVCVCIYVCRHELEYMFNFCCRASSQYASQFRPQSIRRQHLPGFQPSRSCMLPCIRLFELKVRSEALCSETHGLFELKWSLFALVRTYGVQLLWVLGFNIIFRDAEV